MSAEDMLIEEAAMIWHRERDGLPTTIWRCRFRQMLGELFTQMQPVLQHGPQAAQLRAPDRKCLAAGDDTWNPEPEPFTL